MVAIDMWVRPTESQANRLIRLATVRAITDLPATRAERVAAMNRLLDRISRREAATLITVLQDAPFARHWQERTPAFREAHDIAVESLGGPRRDLTDVQWIPDPRPPVTLSEEDKAFAKALISPQGWRKLSPAETQEWADGLKVQEDETWGTVLVGPWE